MSPDALTTAKLVTGKIQHRLKELHLNSTVPTDVKEYIAKISMRLTEKTSRCNSLILAGGNGSGKSTVSKAISDAFGKLPVLPADYDLNNNYAAHAETYSATKIVSTYASSSEEGNALRDRLSARYLLVIDDLGKESPTVKCYGTEISPVADVIRARYDKGLPTIITTNLTADEIAERYGVDVLDRMKEQYEVVLFDNKSFRNKNN
jgi:DNA replication protein DnaC